MTYEDKRHILYAAHDVATFISTSAVVFISFWIGYFTKHFQGRKRIKSIYKDFLELKKLINKQ